MKLEDLRKKLDLTYAQLGDKIGVSMSTSWKYCNDGLVPRAHTIRKAINLSGGKMTHSDFYPE